MFSKMVNDCMEIFMDDFTPYDGIFYEALENEKVLKCCKQTHLSLSIKKIHMMKNSHIVLGNFVSVAGI